MNIRKSINPAFLKIKPHRDEIEKFKISLQQLLNRIDTQESEEHNKNDLIDFFKKTYYDPDYYINTYHRKDLVIHSGKDSSSPIGVIIETKSPSNKYEMCSKENINAKALQELLLYYLEERVEANNTGLKHLIVTNVNEWFIFKATDFEKLINNNKKFVKQFTDFKLGGLSGNRTDFFYENIAKPFIETIKDELEYTHFDIRAYKNILKKNKPEDDKKLIAPYKVFTPQHLLVLPFANDSNSLDKKFYSELLHIIGLKEVKQGSKKLIQRYPEEERNSASLLENAITKLDSRDHLSQVENLLSYGATREEQLFAVGLELCITWINRVLFLKLLEAQLLSYHKGDEAYKFLNIERIHNYDDLDNLFFSVLAKKQEDRSPNNKKEFGNIPYLNSSLFEPAPLEHKTIFVTDLRDDLELPIITKTKTVLKNEKGKPRTSKLNAIEYLFKFLDAYDFTSEGKEDIQEDHKTLINASVLGLIFEKINGYKDGSYFTPGFITEYMCRETIRRAVVQKFNEAKGWECKEFDGLYDKIEDRKEANNIVNSLKICDPAVGSGHFLVSALNEVLAIKHELKILEDRDGHRLKEYTVSVENDELVIMDEDNELFDYHPGSSESQRVQKALFHEKQIIIENCLFGVDINPNSVKICRLRLWIELLKNAYYKSEGKLETLPNIDINIKCGNSLISRYDLKVDIKELLKNSKFDIDSYRDAVHLYQHAPNKEYKRKMEELIENIKGEFKKYISKQDPVYKEQRKAENKFRNFNIETGNLFEVEKTAKQKEKDKLKLEKLRITYKKAQAAVKDAENNVIFSNAFEWRFEFPEILDQNGDFIGFDVVIGNPPYVYRNAEIEPLKGYFKNNYYNNSGNFDLYKYFIERALEITRETGYHSFITNSSFLIQDSYVKTREIIVKNTSLCILIPFGPNVFDEATVDSSVYILQKKIYEDNLLHVISPSKPILLLSTEPYRINQSRFIRNDGYVFDYLLKVNEYPIVQKLFDDFPNIEYGFDFGVGINTGYIKSDLTSKTKIDNQYHPMVPGNGISRYGEIRTDGFIMYDKEFVKSKGKLGRALPDEKYFDNDKILVVRTRNLSLERRIISTIDTNRFYNLNRLSNIIAREGFNIYGLLGILNSNLFNWLYSKRFYDYEIKPTYLKTSPLANTNNQRLILKVKSILENDFDDKTNEIIEKEIDQLVYKLYGLTEEEIKIVEGEKELI